MFETANISAINGKTYCNRPDPATATPTPALSPMETPVESEPEPEE